MGQAGTLPQFYCCQCLLQLQYTSHLLPFSDSEYVYVKCSVSGNQRWKWSQEEWKLKLWQLWKQDQKNYSIHITVLLWQYPTCLSDTKGNSVRKPCRLAREVHIQSPITYLFFIIWSGFFFSHPQWKEKQNKNESQMQSSQSLHWNHIACSKLKITSIKHSPAIKLWQPQITRWVWRKKIKQQQAIRQVPTKAALSTYSAEQRRQNIMKGSWEKIRAKRQLSNYCHVQNRFDLGKTNLIYYPSNPGRVIRK